MPEGEEKEQEIGNLFEKIMKENFPVLAKERDVQVQEAESTKQEGVMDLLTPRHIRIKMPKVKDNERNLKVAREK